MLNLGLSAAGGAPSFSPLQAPTAGGGQNAASLALSISLNLGDQASLSQEATQSQGNALRASPCS